MRIIRVGVAYPMNNGDLSFIIEPFDGLHVGMETDLVVDRQNLLRRNVHGGAIVVLERVRIRYHGVEIVIGPRELEDD